MPKILIIEDNEDLTIIISETLLDQQLEVDTVHTGTDGLARIRVEKYDVVVLDLNLPELGGLEICRNIRAERQMVPILVMSGDSNMRKEQVIRAGADDYLQKPFPMKILCNRIQALLQRRADIDRIFEG